MPLAASQQAAKINAQYTSVAVAGQLFMGDSTLHAHPVNTLATGDIERLRTVVCDAPHTSAGAGPNNQGGQQEFCQPPWSTSTSTLLSAMQSSALFLCLFIPARAEE